jgi:hypothetical protein
MSKRRRAGHASALGLYIVYHAHRVRCLTCALCSPSLQKNPAAKQPLWHEGEQEPSFSSSQAQAQAQSSSSQGCPGAVNRPGSIRSLAQCDTQAPGSRPQQAARNRGTNVPAVFHRCHVPVCPTGGWCARRQVKERGGGRWKYTLNKHLWRRHGGRVVLHRLGIETMFQSPRNDERRWHECWDCRILAAFVALAWRTPPAVLQLPAVLPAAVSVHPPVSPALSVAALQQKRMDSTKCKCSRAGALEARPVSAPEMAIRNAACDL